MRTVMTSPIALFLLFCWTVGAAHGHGSQQPYNSNFEQISFGKTKEGNEHSMLLVHLDALKSKIKFIGTTNDKDRHNFNANPLKSFRNPSGEASKLLELEAKLRELASSPPSTRGDNDSGNKYPTIPYTQEENDKRRDDSSNQDTLKGNLSKILENLTNIIIQLLELEIKIQTNGKKIGSNNLVNGNQKDITYYPTTGNQGGKRDDEFKGNDGAGSIHAIGFPTGNSNQRNNTLENLVNVLTKLVDQLVQQQSKTQDGKPNAQIPEQIGTIFIPVLGNGGTSVMKPPGGNSGEHQTVVDDEDGGREDSSQEGEDSYHRGDYGHYSRDDSREYNHRGQDDIYHGNHREEGSHYKNEDMNKSSQWGHISPGVEITTPNTTPKTTIATTTQLPIIESSQSFLESLIKSPAEPPQVQPPSQPLLSGKNEMPNDDYIYKYNYNCMDDIACSEYASSQKNCLSKGCSYLSRKTVPICNYVPARNAVGITFYEADRMGTYYHYLQLKISSECHNIPTTTTTKQGIGWDKSISDLTVERDNIRVTLYDEQNCQGESYIPSKKLDDVTLNFNDRTRSVRVCEEASRTCSAIFSRGSSISVMLHDNEERVRHRSGYESITMALTEECTNVPSNIKSRKGNPWSEIISDVELLDNSNLHLILYDDFNCLGSSYSPSQGPQRNKHELVENFNDKTKSIRVCNFSDTTQNDSNSSTCFLEPKAEGYEATFYASPRGLVTDPSQTLRLHLNTTCTNIPSEVIAPQTKRPWKNSISDVMLKGAESSNNNNTIRVILYDQKGCQGISYSPDANSNQTDLNFDNITGWQSAKICIVDGEPEEPNK